MTRDHIDLHHTGPVLTPHLVVLTLTALLTLFSRFFHHDLFGYFEDDFFYYAQVARNLATHHGSTFDGVHLTNGYHPLWLLVLLVLYKLFPGAAFFLAVQAVSLAAILTFYAGLLRCLRCLHLDERLVPLTALLLSLHALLLFRFGMEVTLALPFGVWMLATILRPDFAWSTRDTILYGTLACLTVLSRLDGLLLVVALITAQTLTSTTPWLTRLRRLALFAICFLPFFVYLALNLHLFHSLLPISGVAKQLKPLLPPSLAALRSLVLPFDRTKAAFVYPALLVIGLGLLALRRAAGLFTPPQRAILLALFAFPLLHLASLSLLSDWTLWPWYFYSLIYPVLASAVLILSHHRNRAPQHGSPPPNARRLAVAILTALIASYALYLTAYSLFKKPSNTSQLALFVVEFAHGHPGRYAMGDAAGSAAFRSGSPFLQLEGLMVDADYITLLRQRTPLRDVLRRYNTDFYVALGIERQGPCFVTHEPAQAGPHSPHLAGRICAQPLAQEVRDGVSVGIFRAEDVLAP